MLKALFALVAAALFSGAALSISLAGHSARVKPGDGGGLEHERKSQRVANAFQTSLALISSIFGVWAWWKTGDDLLLVGGLLMAAAIVFTLVVIMPVSGRLGGSSESAAADGSSRLRRWDQLHWVSSLLGLAAVTAYLCAFLRP